MRPCGEKYDKLADRYEALAAERGAWKVQADEDKARIAQLEAALRKLANETGGSLRGFEPEVRAAIGNTNWECVMLRVREAAALLLTAPETDCDPTMQHGPECPILHGYACNCTPIPLDHK